MRGLPKVSFKDTIFCNIVSTERPHALLHIDLFGPTMTTSMSDKCYRVVVVDDFSRWTWVIFLVYKDKAF